MTEAYENEAGGEVYAPVAALPSDRFLQVHFATGDQGEERCFVEGVEVHPEEGESLRNATVLAMAGVLSQVAGRDEFNVPYDAVKAVVGTDTTGRFVVVYRDARMYVPTEHPGVMRLLVGPLLPAPDDAPVPPPSYPSFIRLRRPDWQPFPAPTPPQEPVHDTQDGAALDPDLDPELDAQLDDALDAHLEERFAGHFAAEEPSGTRVEPAVSAQHVIGVSSPLGRFLGGRPGGSIGRSTTAPSAPNTNGAGELSNPFPEAAMNAPPASSKAAPGHASRSFAGATAATPSPTPLPSPGTPHPAAVASAPALTSTPKSVLPRHPGLATTTRGTRKRRAALAGIGATVAAALVLAGVFAAKDPSGETPAVPVVATGPSYADAPAWATPALAQAAGPAVVAGDSVGYVTQDGTLTVVDAATGTPRWTQEVGTTIQGPLAATRITGTEAVAIYADGRLRAWSVADGKALAAVTLPANAQVTYLGTAPLVGVGPSTVAVIGSAGLENIDVPAGAYPLAASENRTVTAASPSGWWHLRPGVAAGAPRPFEDPAPDGRPADAQPEVLGYVASSIVLRYPAFLDRRPEIVVHTDLGNAVRVAFRGVSVPVKGASLVAAPRASWGVHGRTLIDVKAGSVTDLGEWTTRGVTMQRAYGTLGGGSASVEPGRTPVAFPTDAAIPEANSPAGGLFRVAGPARSEQGHEAVAEGQEVVTLVPPRA